MRIPAILLNLRTQFAMKHLVAALLLSIFPSLRAENLTVFAAASLTESLQEIATAYEKQTGDKIVFNFAASGPLVRQIEAGAPADLFFSADEAKMDDAEKMDLLVKGSRCSLLSNRLVIVAALDGKSAISSPKDLASAGVGRVALGDAKTVPAGAYAKEYLSKLKIWDSVGEKAVPCESVRAVLAAVESGNVDAGIVYKTDAAISRKVKVVFEVPTADGPVISYPLALLKDSPHPDAAKKLIAYLSSADAGRVFIRKGFMLLPAIAK